MPQDGDRWPTCLGDELQAGLVELDTGLKLRLALGF
jgi:hypothetical protein